MDNRIKETMFKRISIVILLPLIIILVNAHFLILSQSFYEKEFEKHNIYNNFNKTKEAINLETAQIIQFLKGRGELTTDFLQQKEKQHLNDVKTLLTRYKLGTIVGIILLAGLIALTKDKKAVLYGSITTIILLLILLLLIATNFSQLFFAFHEVSFTNKLWLLNPETDNLIKLFPEAFFYDITFTIVKNSIATALIIIIGINVLQKLLKRKFIKE